MLRVLLSRIRGTLSKRRMDEEFDQELRAHLDLLQERFIRQGMEPVEAFYAARRQFGGLAQVKQDLRDRRALPCIDLLVQDIRRAFRQLRRSKRFAASAAVTLALGIGATTAVFAALHTVILQPLPYPQPDRLMAFWSLDRRGPAQPTLLSYPDFFDFRDQNRTLSGTAVYRDRSFALSAEEGATSLRGQKVSGEFFDVLGIKPQIGRGFTREDEQAGGGPAGFTVIIGHDFWQRHFGGDRNVIGGDGVQARITSAIQAKVA